MTPQDREREMRAVCAARDALEDAEGSAYGTSLGHEPVKKLRQRADDILGTHFQECPYCELKPLVSFDGRWHARCPMCGHWEVADTIGVCEDKWNIGWDAE